MLLISSIIPAKIDLYGDEHTTTYSENNKHSIIFYNTTGNDSTLFFVSDIHDTYVLSLNGSTGNATFYGNVSILKNFTVDENVDIVGLILSDLLPNPTLALDLGSGANRWKWLYVSNVSSDTLNATISIGTPGDLYVGGNVNITGDFALVGDTTISGNLTVDENLYIDGITVMGPDGFLVSPTDTGASIRFNVTTGGDVSMSGTFSNTGNMNIADTLEVIVTGAPDRVNITGQFNVDGESTFTGSVTASAFHGDGGNLTNVTGKVDYAQAIIVAKSGGDYTTIQGAINSITDATSTKRYCIKVQSGVYVENITMKNYVDILGAGRTNSIIYGTSGTVLYFPTVHATVLDMGITVEYGTIVSDSEAIVSSGADSTLIRCDIRVSKTGGDFLMNAINVSGGAFRLLDSYFYYSIGGSTTDSILTQSAVRQTGELTIFLFYNNEITMICDDTNDHLVGFETVAGSAGSYLIENNIINVDADGCASSATGLWLYGTATGATVIQNRIIVNCSASAYGLWIESAMGGAVVKTRYNELIVTAVGASQSCYVNVGDTWDSRFDSVVAKSGIGGTGVTHYVYSPSPGNLSISGYLSVTGGFIFPTSAPTTPVNGSCWFNATTGELGIYSEVGSKWYWK